MNRKEEKNRRNWNDIVANYKYNIRIEIDFKTITKIEGALTSFMKKISYCRIL